MAPKKKAPHSKAADMPGETPDGPKETFIPGTDEYSRVMKPDEYREWVRQTVSGHIWGRMAAIFSAVGFATIIAMFTYISTVSNSTIEGKIATETKRLNEEVEKKLPNVVNLELGNQIRNNQLIPLISKNAVEQISENKGVETVLKNLIITQSQKLLMDRDPSQSSLRAVALQQILLFGDEKQKIEAITGIIHDEGSGEQEFSLALQNYPSHQPKNSADQRQSLRSILERSALRNANFSVESWRAIEQILKQDKNIVEAGNWIKITATPLDSKYGVDSLQNLVQRLAKIGGPAAGEQFVAWLESNDELPKALGQSGLIAMSPLEDSAKRQSLAARLTKALANTKLPKDGFIEHVAEFLLAVRQKDKAALRRIGESEFASQKIKQLIEQLVREPESRERWNFATRNLSTLQSVQNYGGYGYFERNLSAYRILGALLDTSTNSSDWDKLVQPKIAEASGKWTPPGQANLLVNAWVTASQNSASPSLASINAAADLFLDAHIRNDPDLLSYSVRSYRYLMNRADDSIFKRFIDKAPAIIGVADRDESAEVNDNEASILADALSRLLREEVSAGRVKQIRDAFPQDLNEKTIQRSSAIWFSAVAQYATLNKTSGDQILLTLIERIKKGSLRPKTAATLLSIVTNKSFLRLKTMQDAAESVNLHLFYDEVRSKSDAFINDLTQVIATDAKNAIRWVDTLPELSVSMGTDPVQLKSDTTWLSFNVPAGQVAEFSIEPPTASRYTLVGSSNRVSRAPQDLDVPADPSEPIRFIPSMEELGQRYLRIELLSREAEPTPEGQPKIALNYLNSFRAADLPSPKKGGTLGLASNDTVAIESKGDDEAWFRISAEPKKAYALRTRALQPGVDTVIEVYDQTENLKLQEDDDGGEDLSSSLPLQATDNETVYHIRVKNTGRAGSFVFAVAEIP